MGMRQELETVTSTMAELAARISVLVESESELSSEAYTELVAAERQVGTLLRRLQRVASRLPS
jgi:hypothetical protein